MSAPERGARRARLLAVSAPAMAVACVVLGLRLGAPTALRGALVYASPPSGGRTSLAWQVVVFDEDHGLRTPVHLDSLEVTAERGDHRARWSGPTTEDGVAEVRLALPPSGPLRLEVRSGEAVLAAGETAAPPALAPDEAGGSAWARFARREGSLALDVAVLGQRAASGFPASLWVRTTEAGSGQVVAGALVALEAEDSLAVAAGEVWTDARGWAHFTATPMGYAVPLIFAARRGTGASGGWAGALFVSPGAGRIAMPDRVAPDDATPIDVVMPGLRRVAYLEVDDASGRAWAAAMPLSASASDLPRAAVSMPPLAPGLYWAVASSDPSGATTLGPGTVVRPFFVARSSEEALPFGTDPEACTPPAPPADPARAVSVCLALVAARPAARRLVLDGLARAQADRARRRDRGLAIAVGATVAAALLEALLLVRLARATRAGLRRVIEGDETANEVAWGAVGRWGAAVLVALLGFALLAAFLVRVG